MVMYEVQKRGITLKPPVLVLILVWHAHLLYTGTMCMKLYCYELNTVEASMSWRHKLSLYGYVRSLKRVITLEPPVLVLILVWHAHLLYTGIMCMKLYCYDSNTVEASMSWRHNFLYMNITISKRGITSPNFTKQMSCTFILHIYQVYQLSCLYNWDRRMRLKTATYIRFVTCFRDVAAVLQQSRESRLSNLT